MLASEFPNVKIDPEFRSLCPPLSEEENRILDEKLQREGCLEKLKVWKEEGCLLDGQHRFAICKNRGILPLFDEMSFSSRSAARNWIIMNQLGRRNISPTWRDILRGKLSKAEIEEVKKNKGAIQESLQEIAQHHDCSITKIKDDIQLSENVDNVIQKGGEVAREVIMSGKVSKQDIAQMAEMTPDDVKTELAEIKTRKGKTKRKGGIRKGAGRKSTKQVETQKGDAYEGKSPEEKEVDKVLAEPHDHVGQLIPRQLLDVFADALVSEATDYLKTVLSTIRNNQKVYPYLHTDAVLSSLESAAHMLEQGQAWAVCQECNAHGCKHCRMSGYLSQHAYEQAQALSGK